MKNKKYYIYLCGKRCIACQVVIKFQFHIFSARGVCYYIIHQIFVSKGQWTWANTPNRRFSVQNFDGLFLIFFVHFIHQPNASLFKTSETIFYSYWLYRFILVQGYKKQYFPSLIIVFTLKVPPELLLLTDLHLWLPFVKVFLKRPNRLSHSLKNKKKNKYNFIYFSFNFWCVNDLSFESLSKCVSMCWICMEKKNWDYK